MVTAVAADALRTTRSLDRRDGCRRRHADVQCNRPAGGSDDQPGDRRHHRQAELRQFGSPYCRCHGDGWNAGRPTFTTTVGNANRPPTLKPMGNLAQHRSGTSISVVGADPDNETLTFGATGLPVGVTIDVHRPSPRRRRQRYADHVSASMTLSDSRSFVWTVSQTEAGGVAFVQALDASGHRRRAERRVSGSATRQRAGVVVVGWGDQAAQVLSVVGTVGTPTTRRRNRRRDPTSAARRFKASERGGRGGWRHPGHVTSRRQRTSQRCGWSS